MNLRKDNGPAPGFLRRMGAITYDTLVLLGVLIVTTALLLPFNGGYAISPDQWLYPAVLLIVSFLFFGWFWTHGGQTLGMRAWKIKVITKGCENIGWNHALVRFLMAIISWGTGGLGFFWMLLNRDKLAWHDFLSRTKIDWDERIAQ